LFKPCCPSSTVQAITTSIASPDLPPWEAMRTPLLYATLGLLAPLVSIAMDTVKHIGECKRRGHCYIAQEKFKCWQRDCTVWFPTGEYIYTCVACQGTSAEEDPQAPKPACPQHPKPFSQLNSHGKW
jgi:hypothetical protein